MQTGPVYWAQVVTGAELQEVSRRLPRSRPRSPCTSPPPPVRHREDVHRHRAPGARRCPPDRRTRRPIRRATPKLQEVSCHPPVRPREVRTSGTFASACLASRPTDQASRRVASNAAPVEQPSNDFPRPLHYASHGRHSRTAGAVFHSEARLRCESRQCFGGRPTPAYAIVSPHQPHVVVLGRVSGRDQSVGFALVAGPDRVRRCA